MSNQDGKSKTTPTNSNKRKTRFTFNPSRDILLLKAVVQNETWTTGNWDDVKDSLKLLNLNITKKSVKDRCEHLMSLYRAESLKAINRSGTESEYDERANILRDLCQFFDAEKVIKVNGPENDEEDLPDIIETDDIDPLDNVQAVTILDEGEEIKEPGITIIPTKKLRLEDKKRADKDRDHARDQILKSCIPQPTKTRKTAHLDVVEEKIRFEMEVKKKELDLREKKLKLKEDSQVQHFELKKKELENEEKRIEIAAQTSNNNATMLKLVEELLKSKNKI